MRTNRYGQRKSALELTTLLAQRQQHEAELGQALTKIRSELTQIEQAILAATMTLNETEAERSRLRSAKNDIALVVQGCTDELASKRQQLEERHRRVQTTERHILSVEKRLNSIQEFNSQAGGDTLQKAEDLRAQRDDLSKRHLALLTRRLELASHLNDRLLPRRKRIVDEIASLDIDSIKQKLSDAENEIQTSGERLDSATVQGESLEADLSRIGYETSSLEDDLARRQREEERLQRTVQNQMKTIETIMARISLLKQREEECMKQQKDIGPLPETEIKEREGLSARELHRELAGINTEAKRFRHVNKKAIEQHRAFSAQQEDLEAREQELSKSAESIRKLISTLDARKEEAIARTFAQVSENFSQIFSELEPAARGQLVLQCDEDTGAYTGVAIRAQFGDQAEVASIAQFSGGQKALVALTLVFAIQRYAPAPFYLFDEVDSALDQKYRRAVAGLMHQFCHPEANVPPAQIIFTTFKPELLEGCDKYFAVKYDRGRSVALEITATDANRIVAEQHEGDDD
jgi:structural maintenance of chromosome 3 (chondroitin sulfate proteoglycan 6)